MAKPPFRPARKRPWSQPLADLIEPVIAPALAKQGFGESQVVMHWADIVGPRLARASEPIRMQWPPQRAPDLPPEPATLHVRVEGGLAIEMQHMAPVIVERVNAHLGWRCVGRLALKQGPLGLERRVKKVRLQPDAAAVAQAQAGAAGIENEGLRAALANFGAVVIASGKK